MASTKTKAKKMREAAITATPPKSTRKAGNKKLAVATSGRDQLLRAEDEVVPNHDKVSQKLDALMRTMADLSIQVKDLSSHVEATKTARGKWKCPMPVSMPLVLLEGGPSPVDHLTWTKMWPRKSEDE